MLIETLKRHWWVPVLRGIAAVVFGVMAFVYPGLTAAVLVLLFGAWVLVDGIFRVIGAIAGRASDSEWGFNLIIGIIGIIIGLLTFHAPRITALALVIYIAVWALMIGATEIALAIKLPPGNQRRMVPHPYGPAFNCLRCHAFMEPPPGCARSCVVDRVLCDRVWNPRDYSWLPIAQLTDISRPLVSRMRLFFCSALAPRPGSKTVRVDP